jgi:phosphoribosyl isomerase A
MLAGPATARLREVLVATARPVIASGGVAGLDDLRALAELEPDGLEGVIVGRALYAGRLTVAEALATLAAGGVRGTPRGCPGGSGGVRR